MFVRDGHVLFPVLAASDHPCFDLLLGHESMFGISRLHCHKHQIFAQFADPFQHLKRALPIHGLALENPVHAVEVFLLAPSGVEVHSVHDAWGREDDIVLEEDAVTVPYLSFLLRRRRSIEVEHAETGILAKKKRVELFRGLPAVAVDGDLLPVVDRATNVLNRVGDGRAELVVFRVGLELVMIDDGGRRIPQVP